MTTSAIAVKPLEIAKETILGMTNALEQRFGCIPLNDAGTTLNTKFNVFPSHLPANQKLTRYFCWGVGGRINDTSTNLSSAQYPLGTNMALYNMRPFRAVPLESDLPAVQRAQYALREVRTINGVPYCLYWLKLINFGPNQVQYVRTDPVSGTQASYQTDYAGLGTGTAGPTPPTADSNGVVSDVADAVSIVLPGTVTITGQEVLESAAVMDGGDMRYAIASEMGFVSASTEQMSANSFNNQPFSYAEAIFAQLQDHYNWVGQPFLSTSDSWSRTLNFSFKSLIVSG